MDKFKAITGIGAIGLVALIAFLFWQVNNLKSENAGLKWTLTTIKAKVDTVKIPGVYSPPDTIWKRVEKIVYRESGQADTIYMDILETSGKMSFDTTKVFGENHNPLSVHVSYEVYWPEKLSHKNWLLIVPEFGKPPTTPVTGRSPGKWGVGLGYTVSSSGVNSIGGFGRFNKTSVALYRQFDQNVWMLGLNYEILRF